jgi:predicted XRE-type DNA-binding protein
MRGNNPRRHPRHSDEVLMMKEFFAFQIALAIGDRNLTDRSASNITGVDISSLENIIRREHHRYGVFLLMQVLARLGIEAWISVRPESTVIRAGGTQKTIRPRTGLSVALRPSR